MKPEVFSYKPFIYADEWAERNVILKDTGRFRYNVTPFFKLPTQAASNLEQNCRIVIKSSAQLGKSQTLLNLIGWMSEYDPSNSLIIMDSLKTGQRFSKNRLKPFLRDTCKIDAFNKNAKDKSKETTNLSLGTGANLIIGSASSASDLCSTPVKWLFADELDRWTDELGVEGDPLLLAFKRQMRFMGMAILTSTPTRPDGRINQHYLLGTQEVWSALCGCGCFMRVSYDEIDFTCDDPFYACPQCGHCYTEEEIQYLPHLYAPPKNRKPYVDKWGRIARSFEITSTLCHSQYTWHSLRMEDLQAQSLGTAAIASFRNTALGEVYVPPEQEVLSVPALGKYATGYTPNSVPDFVDYITVGIDVQHNAFPWLVIGLSKDLRKMAIIQAGMILGDLRTAQPWNELKQFLANYRITKKDGTVKPISLAAIDSGGHSTREVYTLALENPRIRAIKGCVESKARAEQNIIYKISRASVKEVATGIGKVDLTLVNTVFVKDIIYTHLHAKLHNRAEGSEWMWPAGFGIDSNFFEQLTSEVRRYNTRGMYIYEKLAGRENHYLDCLVYAIAAGESIRLIKGELPTLQADAIIMDSASNENGGESKPDAIEDTAKPVEIKKEKKIKYKPQKVYKPLGD